MSITSYEHLSLIEDILIGCYRKLNRKEKVAIQMLIAGSLAHIELLLAIGKAGTKLSTRQIKKRGGGGGIKRAWVVEVGVTHTISKKNPNGTYSKKNLKLPTRRGLPLSSMRRRYKE